MRPVDDHPESKGRIGNECCDNEDFYPRVDTKKIELLLCTLFALEGKFEEGRLWFCGKNAFAGIDTGSAHGAVEVIGLFADIKVDIAGFDTGSTDMTGASFTLFPGYMQGSGVLKRLLQIGIGAGIFAKFMLEKGCIVKKEEEDKREGCCFKNRVSAFKILEDCKGKKETPSEGQEHIDPLVECRRASVAGIAFF